MPPSAALSRPFPPGRRRPPTVDRPSCSAPPNASVPAARSSPRSSRAKRARPGSTLPAKWPGASRRSRSRARRPSGSTARRCRWMRLAFGERRVGFYLRAPLGVVSAITPFNFPLNLVAHKVAPALAAGNTLVLKPAEETPLTAVLMAECFRDAGLADGVMELVHGPGDSDRARLWCAHPGPAKVSFTGSPPVGAHILKRRRSQARHARTRQQLGHHRRAGRRASIRPCRGGDVRVRQLRPGLHQPAAALRPRGDRRRRSSSASSPRPAR